MNTPQPAARSTFVTVLAWVLITFGGFAVFVALMQNVMINVMLPTLVANLPASGQATQVFPTGVFRVFGICWLLFASFMTYSAYALLKRRNWARRTFVVLFALGIAWNVLFVLGFGFGVGFAKFPTTGPAAVPPEMHMMMSAMAAMFGVFALVMSILYGWLIKRLRSASVKAEFSSVVAVT
jgi:hypothetical protein